jgi:hypothetical protein
VLVTFGSVIRPLLGGLPPWIVIATCLWIVLVQATVAPQWWPAAQRQVPSNVIGLGSVLGPLKFGFEMGTGVRTYMPVPVPLMAAACVLLLLDVVPALAVGVGFGLGRATMTTSRYLHRPGAHAWDRLLTSWLATVQWSMTCVVLGVALYLAARSATA